MSVSRRADAPKVRSADRAHDSRFHRSKHRDRGACRGGRDAGQHGHRLILVLRERPSERTRAVAVADQRGRRSVQCARWQNKPGRRLWTCSVAVDPPAVQTARRPGSGRCFGLAGMVADPLHHGWEIRTLGQNGGTLEDSASGGVRAGQPRHQGKNRVVVHKHTVLASQIALDAERGERLSPSQPARRRGRRRRSPSRDRGCPLRR